MEIKKKCANYWRKETEYTNIQAKRANTSRFLHSISAQLDVH